MLRTRSHSSRSRGFVAALLFAAVALGAALAYAFATANRDSAQSSTQQQNATLASSVISQAANTQQAMNRVLANSYSGAELGFNGAPVNGVTYAAGNASCRDASGNISNNITDCSALRATTINGYDSQVFHPQGGGVLPPIPPGSAMAGVSPRVFVYARNQDIAGIGTGTAPFNTVIFLPNLKLGICQAINNQLHGDLLSTAPHVSNLTDAAAEGGTSVAGWTTVTTGNPRPEGCVQAGASGRYVYYRTVLVN
jgi:hypothetical protein